MDPERIKKLQNLALKSISGFGDRKLLDTVFATSIPEKKSKLRFSGRKIYRGEKMIFKIKVENQLFVLFSLLIFLDRYQLRGL